MARRQKSSENAENAESSSEVGAEPGDTEIAVDAEDGESNEADGAAAQADSREADTPLVVEAEAVDVSGAVDDEPEAASVGDAAEEQLQDVAAEPELAATATARPSVIPMVLGGLVAGAIGFGIASYAPIGGTGGADDVTTEAIQENSAQIEALTARLNGLPEPETVDLSQIEVQVAEIAARVDGLSEEVAAFDPDTRLADFGGQLAAFGDRLRRIEEQPDLGDGSSARAVAAEEELTAFRAELDRMIADADARVAQAEAKAAELEEAAAAAALEAKRQASLAGLRAAIEGGTPFADSLESLDDVPPALAAAAEDGVPTLVSLQQGFPDAARAALASVQTVPDDASTGERLTAFLKRQTNARSLTPRDGDDPDAVLSRAEARLNEGDLGAALAEVETLPNAAKSAMSGWLSEAHARADAMSAVDELFAVLN